MFRQKYQNLSRARAFFVALPILAVLAISAVLPFGQDVPKVAAAASTTVNFQARLQNASGSIVPDGFYNVEFKLYDAASGSTALWTETRTGGNTVRVVNGYLTVNLGSVTAFGSSINWDQELWLTMNVGGTGTPNWDGEMSPRLKLTAVPYAFRAKELALQTGANTSTLGWNTQNAANNIWLPDESGTICIQSSSNCGFVSGTDADYIQNQSTGQQPTSDFWISGTGRADTALQTSLLDTASSGTLAIGTTNATAINLNQNTTVAASRTLTVTSGLTSLTSNGTTGDALHVSNSTSTGNIAIFSDGSTAVLTLADGGGATFQTATDTTEALAVKNQSDGYVLSVDTENDRVGIGTSAPGRTLDVVVNDSTTDAPPLRIIQEGSGDTSFELQDINGKSYFIGMDASDGGSFKLSSSTSAKTATIVGETNENNFTSTTTSSDTIWATKFTTGAGVSGTLSAISVYTGGIDAGDPDAQVAIYSHNSGTDRPDDLIASSSTQDLVAGWNTFSASAVISPSTTYWLAANFDGNNTRNFGSGTRLAIYEGVTFGNWPDLGAVAPTFVPSSQAFPINMSVVPAGDVDSFNGTNLLTITDSGAVTFQNSANSSGAFRVLNASDMSLFQIDTSSSRVYVGNVAADDTGALLVLDSKDDAGGSTVDPTGTNGGMYYNVDSGKFRCYEAGAWRDCITEVGGTAFVQGGNDFNGTAVLGTNDSDNLQLETNNVVRATFDTSNNLYLGNGVTAGSPSNFTIQGTGSSTTGVAGGSLTIQGGNATVGNANGGTVTITGGTGVGTGVRGLVVIDTPTFTTASTQNCATNCTILQTNIDNNAAVLINATNPSLTATLPDPTITTAGRIMYVTNVGTNDFTLSVNGGGTGNTIAMKPNTTATMIWNGSDWTAAGASSSTDLQSAYNNTLTSAGGAELILNAPGGSADGLTIRNNATTPIVGGLLEVQTSIGSNLLSVNNNATEYANNGGAESTTFSMWAAVTGGSVSRYTTAGDNIATGAASVFVNGASTANSGVKNTLAASLTPNLKYKVSFAIRHTSTTTTFNTLDVNYSNDGTAVSSACATGQTVTNGRWTRVNCSFTAPSSGITSGNAILIRHSDGSDHDFYIDNLSVTVGADANHVADGSVDLALGSNWTGFDADGGAGTTTLARETTVIYDTSGSVSDATTANANLGLRNNLGITPQTNTQYLITFYARSSNTFNDITVGFLPTGGNSVPVAAERCTDYNTQSVSTTGWTKITCLVTTGATVITDPDLVIYQSSATARTFYIDALSMTLNTNTASNVQIGGGNKGGPATLLTLDRSAGAPIADNNDAYLGSMYYDTVSGRIQCYEADGWGACGAAPDNVVNLNPEYAGAVLNGGTSPGVGTMTADFCSNDTALTVNSTLCGTGEAKNFYKWTSPQGSMQTYSIYVTYQLPATFNGFASDDTVQLVARVDDVTDAAVTYEMFKSTGGAVTQCGSGETDVVAGGGGAADTWYSYGINGNEATGCSFNSSSAGNFIIFKINVKARNNANAYVSTLSFTTTGR